MVHLSVTVKSVNRPQIIDLNDILFRSLVLPQYVYITNVLCSGSILGHRSFYRTPNADNFLPGKIRERHPSSSQTNPEWRPEIEKKGWMKWEAQIYSHVMDKFWSTVILTKKYEIKRNDFNGRTFYPTFRSTTRFFTGSDSNKIVKYFHQEKSTSFHIDIPYRYRCSMYCTIRTVGIWIDCTF